MDTDLNTVRTGAKGWLQMLARAGVTQLPVGSQQSAFTDWVDDLKQPAEQASASQPTQTSESAGASSSATSPAASPQSVPKSRSTVTSTTPSGRTPAFKASGDTVDDGPAISTFPDLAVEQRQQQLTVLADQVAQCTLCPDLVAYRTQTVFGTGNLKPRLVMMGEAPGADEDRLGEPMVGLAGQLLDKIIAAMKLKREDVYILNTVKCRPPNNRNPLEQECGNCRQFWRQQLEILKPECIVCLGAVASKTLLQSTLPVGRLRGKFHDYRGISVAVTYHPAYLLRTESAKRQTWEDMKMVMAKLGINI